MLECALLTTQADPPQQTLGAVGGWESLCTTAQSAGDRWEEEGGKEASEELAQELPPRQECHGGFAFAAKLSGVVFLSSPWELLWPSLLKPYLLGDEPPRSHCIGETHAFR